MPYVNPYRKDTGRVECKTREQIEIERLQQRVSELEEEVKKIRQMLSDVQSYSD